MPARAVLVAARARRLAGPRSAAGRCWQLCCCSPRRATCTAGGRARPAADSKRSPAPCPPAPRLPTGSLASVAAQRGRAAVA
eukprot:7125197-Prymnesium_polylepis.2